MFTDAYSYEPTPVETSGKFLSAEEVSVMIDLMKELRDVTLSRKTFAAANDFLSRYASEDVRPRLVAADALEH